MSTDMGVPNERRPQTSTAPSWNRFAYAEPFVTIIAALATTQALLGGLRYQFQDFRIFYTAATAMATGAEPYARSALGPNLNPPWFLLLIRPFTVLPYPIAVALWTGVSVAAAAVALRMIASASRTPSRLLWTVFLATDAAALTLRQGQVAFILMACMTYAWLSNRRHQSFTTGAVLAVVMFWKPFLGVFGALLVWERNWRALAGLALAGGAMLLVLVLTGHTGAWLATLATVNWQAHPANASLYGLVTRMFDVPPTTPFLVDVVPLLPNRGAKWAVLVALVVFVLIRTVFSLRDANEDRRWAIAGLVSLLLSPLAEINYLLLMTGPLVSVLRPTKNVLAAVSLLLIPWFIVGHIYGRSALSTVTLANINVIAVALLWFEVTRRAGANVKKSSA